MEPPDRRRPRNVTEAQNLYSRIAMEMEIFQNPPINREGSSTSSNFPLTLLDTPERLTLARDLSPQRSSDEIVNITENVPLRDLQIPTRSQQLTDSDSDGESVHPIPAIRRRPKIQSFFKFMRQLFTRRIGRRGIPDLGQNLMVNLDSVPRYDTPILSTGLSAEVLPRSLSCLPPPFIKNEANVLNVTGPEILEKKQYQVCVRIIEAKKLPGIDLDPVVYVQLDNQRKCTSVKEGTNCPYFNDFFVFEFNIAPKILMDKVLTIAAFHAQHILRNDILIGCFKIDLGSVWAQPNHQYYRKWMLLTDPRKLSNWAPVYSKGYLKCDIAIIVKGEDIQLPVLSAEDEDDIESNLLLPVDIMLERPLTRYRIKIYHADGLPHVQRNADQAQALDFGDPFVQVTFCGKTAKTSTKINCNQPEWNEELIFTESFPPSDNIIEIKLKDASTLGPQTIATKRIDLRTISKDADPGFLPTKGPSYIFFYGGMRASENSTEDRERNEGLREGLQYRGRLLMSIRTEIARISYSPYPEVQILPIPRADRRLNKNAEFLIFASLIKVSEIDKSFLGRNIQFEVSMGNAGNSFDGPKSSLRSIKYFTDFDNKTPDDGYWQSVTSPMRPVHRRRKIRLPKAISKNLLEIHCIWPDHRERTYNYNRIRSIMEQYDEGVSLILEAFTEDGPSYTTAAALRAFLETLSKACSKYVESMSGIQSFGKTKLDRELLRASLAEINHIGELTNELRSLITTGNMKDNLRVALFYLYRLRSLCEEVPPAFPDLSLCMLCDGERVAIRRINPADVIYSENFYERGPKCGKRQTAFLKWIKKRDGEPWSIPAKVELRLWLLGPK